jgi:endonuclease/exonuclease/phosphatase (EEP) superfamily protein YafD
MLLALTIFSILLLIISAITLVQHDFWIFKIFEYPRLQKLILMGLAITGWLLLWPRMDTEHFIMLGLLIGFAFYYGSKIFPYTAWWPKEVRKLPSKVGKEDLKIFSANVLQDNHRFEDMLAQIRATDPDIVFLLETDLEWEKAMSVLKKDYPTTPAKTPGQYLWPAVLHAVQNGFR